MKIYFATDHAGFELKEKLKDFVIDLGYEVQDFGAFKYDEKDDYPDYISKCAKAISQNKDEVGIVLGGSGQGEAMVANRYKGVRCTVYYGGKEDILKLSKEHNDANILSLGARFLNESEAKSAVQIWLNSKFLGEERHLRRINKIDFFEDSFDEWNVQKKEIDRGKHRPFYKEREIWWCSLGQNIGFEQDGKNGTFTRPVLVYKNFNNKVFWGIPLTKKNKDSKYYFNIEKNKLSNSLILSQMRLLDSSRLLRKLFVVNDELFKEVKEKVGKL